MNQFQYRISMAKVAAVFLLAVMLIIGMSPGVEAGTALPGAAEEEMPRESVGSLAGRVLDKNSNTAVAGIRIVAVPAGSFLIEAYEMMTGRLAASVSAQPVDQQQYTTVSDQNGHYLFQALPAGFYTVRADASGTDYVSAYHDGAVTAGSSTAVEVIADTVTDRVDLALIAGGSVSGRLTADDGTALDDVVVSAVHFSSGEELGRAESDDDGRWHIRGLAAGKYMLKAEGKGSFGALYYPGAGDAAGAAAVLVQNGAAAAGFDFVLPRFSSVSGRVTGEDGGPLSGVRLYAYPFDLPVYPPPRPAGVTASRQDGEFILDKLPAGRYRLVADPLRGYVRQTWGGIDAQPAAPVVTTTGGRIDGVNFVLQEGGLIAGRVFDQVAGLALATVRIEAWLQGAKGAAGHSFSNNRGEYAIDGLAAGSYTVKASASRYQSRFFNNAADSGAATVVRVDAGIESGAVDFRLPAAPMPNQGKISGRLNRNTDGAPAVNVCIYAYQKEGGGFAGTGCARADGSYEINNLADGEYRLCSKAGRGYVDECYRNADPAVPEQARMVSVSNGGHVDGIDFGLSPLGGIKGVIRRSTGGEPLASYDLKDLAAGRYYLVLRAAGSGYGSIYYPAADGFAGAELVAVSEGAVTTSMDFVVTTDRNRVESHLSGRITADDGVALGYMTVQVLDIDGSVVRETVSGLDGSYRIAGLAAGAYHLKAATAGGDYLTTYYSGVVRAEDASVIELATGQRISGLDLTLIAGAGISGRLFEAASSKALPGIKVCAVPPADPAGRICAVAGADGNWRIAGLLPGVHQILVETAGTPSYKKYGAAARSLELMSGQQLSGFDFALKKLGTISGQVVDQASGLPIGGLSVNVLAAESRQPVPSVFAATDDNGVYTLAGVEEGSYLVFVLSSGTLYRGEYFDDVPGPETATPLTVNAGETIGGINFSLTAGGAISGTVVRADNGRPLSGLWVHILDFQTGHGVVAGKTLADGSYAIRGLSAGSYRVKVSGSGTIFSDQYYNNTQQAAGAAEVGVQLGKETAGIDFAMEVGGQ